MCDLTYMWDLKKAKPSYVFFSPTGEGGKWDLISVPGEARRSGCARVLESCHHGVAGLP